MGPGQARAQRRGARWGWLLLLLLVLVGLWYFLVYREPAPAPVPDLPTPTPPPVTATPSAIRTPTPEPVAEISQVCLQNECRHVLERPDIPDLRLEMIDDSTGWNWSQPTEACLADIAAFMAVEGIDMELVSFTLQDAVPNRGTPVYFQFPPPDDPINAPAPDEGIAVCNLAPDSHRHAYCTTAVSRIDEGEINPNVRLALILAAMDALRRVHYEQVQEDLETYYLTLAEALDRFVPVVREENGTWNTNCWELLP